MRLAQRTWRILADGGMSGLGRRVWRKLLVPKPVTQPIDLPMPGAVAAFPPPALKKEYEQLVANFQARARCLELGNVSRYFWYHTIDLGNGLVTPGDYDYRPDLPHFQFPDDMHGMQVLDVGSATGFFAFEFEKRGAQVTSVELPSLGEWDMPLGKERERMLRSQRQEHQAASVAEAYHLHLDGPFQFCHKWLKSRVRRCYSTVYDLNPQVLGRDSFDLVFVGDLLLHLMSPLRALTVLAPLCKGTMVIGQQLADEIHSVPLMQYIGGAAPQGDCRSWWLPNRACLEQILKRLEFRNVSVAGYYSGIIRRAWEPYRRTIIHASR